MLEERDIYRSVILGINTLEFWRSSSCYGIGLNPEHEKRDGGFLRNIMGS
jgi:hypothetical protein